MKITASQYINLFAGKYKWLDYSGIFFAKWLPYLLVAGLLVWAVLEKNAMMFILPVLSAVVSRYTINELIWIFYKEERPSSIGSTEVLITKPRTPSFPSSHASFFFTISFLLFFYNIPLAIFFTICSCFISFARVFCGVHWLPDIFAGSFIGLASGFVAAAILGFNPDYHIFHFINNFAFRWEWLDILGVFFATRLEYLIWGILLVCLIFNFKKYLKPAIAAVLAGVISRFLFAEIIRFILPRLRPFWDSVTKLLADKDMASSFPSGHASFYFAVSTVIYFYNKKVGMLMYILSFLVVLGRVFAGLHWPSDILAGALLGIFTGWLVYKFLSKYANNFFGGRGSVR